MGRIVVVVVTAVAVALTLAGAASAAPYKAGKDTKLQVLGEWAHPDDDVSIIGPCGVWHDRYDVRCGIIQVTRGEGGGNAVGTELGPALGLRRENEDRVAHFRSGTTDLFYLDKVDFFYNQSAPLTERIWGADTLERVVRVIRTTQPEIYTGFTPTLDAGHGNHQQAGRLIWEGFRQAADPTKFRSQLRGHGGRLSPWQVKKVLSGGSTEGDGGSDSRASCTRGFTPERENLDTVVGTWLGYDSPYEWPAGNLQKRPAGSAKSWAQVAEEGTKAYPTQSRVMYQEVAEPSCDRFGQTAATVPFEPNLGSARAPGTRPNPLAGRDDAVLFGAVKRAPGGLPLGTGMRLDAPFYVAPGTRQVVKLRVSAGSRAVRAGRVRLTLPRGIDGRASKRVGRLRAGRSRVVRFPVTVARGVDTGPVRLAARLVTRGQAGYTDTVSEVVAPVEGRLRRFGKFAEYDRWLASRGRPARRLGRSAANETMAVGSTKTLKVDVRNRSTRRQSGTVRLTEDAKSPGAFAAVAPVRYSVAPGRTTTVRLALKSTDSALPADSQEAAFTLTTARRGGGSSSEPVTISLLPQTTIPKVATAPTIDGTRDAAYDAAPTLDVSRLWQGDACKAGDCGGPQTDAKVLATDDALFFSVRVADDYQAYAVKPQECVAHWQSDSVELLIDPRGDASRRAGVPDTANAFKLAVFPYTDDPTGSNGNGPNGPCWSRDADNRQGFSTGPLSIGNAPGVQVASTARWVGSNDTRTPHGYGAENGYSVEVKVPLAALPAALDPNHFGLDVTPYDNDDTAAEGTTALRRIDDSTRLGWSAFGSVQSDPWRYGRAAIQGGGPSGSDDVQPVDTSSPNLEGAKSPQTIWTSARRGVPISGRTPSRDVRVDRAAVGADAVTMRVRSTGSGTLRAYLWSGERGQIPVWTTSCALADDPSPDFGLTACAPGDGAPAPWGTDQGGRVQGSAEVALKPGASTVTVPVSAEQAQRLRSDGSALVSYVSDRNAVQALDLPLAGRP